MIIMKWTYKNMVGPSPRPRLSESRVQATWLDPGIEKAAPRLHWTIGKEAGKTPSGGQQEASTRFQGREPCGLLDFSIARKDFWIFFCVFSISWFSRSWKFQLTSCHPLCPWPARALMVAGGEQEFPGSRKSRNQKTQWKIKKSLWAIEKSINSCLCAFSISWFVSWFLDRPKRFLDFQLCFLDFLIFSTLETPAHLLLLSMPIAHMSMPCVR